MDYSADFVRFALTVGALEFFPEGRKLRSGRLSPYFFDSSKFCKGKHLSHLAGAYIGAMKDVDCPDVAFGPSYKGSAIVVAVVTLVGGNFGYAYNRKEVKTHGEGGIIVGDSVEGKTVGLFDDVMTKGGSLGEAFDIVVAAKGTPIWAMIAFDRQERGENTSLSAVQEFEKNYKIPVRSVANLDTLIMVVATAPSEYYAKVVLPTLLKYKKEWGVSC